MLLAFPCPNDGMEARRIPAARKRFISVLCAPACLGFYLELEVYETLEICGNELIYENDYQDNHKSHHGQGET